ncbi:flagellar filament capping protein FliD [Desulfonatronovibrio magnus]|uniref:flagellar filament capping protein FliD n=1 Tax=Desulfonatronovibrio magnus TaxID=698827 RepID=UPI0006986A77|nr:flagellar filament capping protein FliD [Desulfonatronovibrio magnus]
MPDTMEMENLISGSMHFTGLGSGTDFNQMVEQLVKLEQRRVARWELWKSDWEEKVEAFQELQTKMVSLRSNLASMDSVNKFFVKETTSSNPGVVRATANSDAEEGSYNIEVGSLAQNHIVFSREGFASTSDPVNQPGEDKFAYSYGGKRVELELPENTSLNGFVNMINSDPNNPGIRASIVNRGDEYFLQLRGMDQGKDNVIELTYAEDDEGNPEEGRTLSKFFDIDGEKMDTSQAAQNAKIKVNGWPVDETDEEGNIVNQVWIERTSNSFSDIVEGVTLNIYSEGLAQINIENDQKAIKEQVYSFVDQVNEVLDLINSQTKVSESGKGSLLTGNYGLQMIEAKLKSVMSSIGIGFDRQKGGDNLPSMSTIGVTIDAERGSPTFGRYIIDDEVLDHVLKNDPRGVAELISGNLEPDTKSQDFRFGTLVRGVTRPGLYDVEYEIDGNGKIIWATIDGNTAGIDGNFITSREGDSRGLSIQVDNLNPGEYKGNVRLKSGKVNEMRDILKDLTDSSNGTLKILERNYEDIMRNIDNKIDFEQRRLDRFERDLRMRFARLEELLGYYDGLQNAMGSQIQSLNFD